MKLTLSNFSDKALEGQLADEEFGALLVATNFAKSDGTRAETVRLLHTTGLSGSLARLLGRELFAWGLATSGFAGGLLSGEISESSSQRDWSKTISKNNPNLSAGHLWIE